MPGKKVKGHRGVKGTANWVVLVEFPASLNVGERLDDKFDSLCGGTCNQRHPEREVRQCWGKDLPDGTRQLRYSYDSLVVAMEVSKRFEAVPGVTRVDVYDITDTGGDADERP